MKLRIKKFLLSLAGFVALAALVLLLGVGFFALNNVAETSYKSPEVAYTAYSPAGPAGGAVIPASCESGYTEHPWNEYCGPAATCEAPVQVYQVARGCYDASRYYQGTGISYTPPSQPLSLSSTCQTLPDPTDLGAGFNLACDGSDRYGPPLTCDNTPVANPVCELPAPTLYFDPASVPYGAGSTVVWSWPETGGTRYCNINTYGSEWNGYATGQDITGRYNPGGMNASGSATATCYKYIPATSSYQASPQASATLIVGPPPAPGNFNLSAGGSVACNSVPLSWTVSSNADAYRILRGSPRVNISPYQPYTALNFTDTTVSQNTTYPYQIEAYNAYGTNRSNTINVTTPYCSPTLIFSGSPSSVYQGQSTTLNWSSNYATSCVASGAWSGSKSVSGSEVVFPSPPPSVTYTLICTGPGGSTGPQSAVINIAPLALPEWKEIIPR